MASVAFIVILLISDSLCCAKTERFNARDLMAVRKDTVFAAFCLISVLLFLVTAQMSSVYSVYSEKVVGIQVYEVGYLYAINGLMVVLLQFPFARWISRFRMTNVISFGFAHAVGHLGGGVHQRLSPWLLRYGGSAWAIVVSWHPAICG
jgi:hypothetical protein